MSILDDELQVNCEEFFKCIPDEDIPTYIKVWYDIFKKYLLSDLDNESKALIISTYEKYRPRKLLCDEQRIQPRKLLPGNKEYILIDEENYVYPRTKYISIWRDDLISRGKKELSTEEFYAIISSFFANSITAIENIKTNSSYNTYYDIIIKTLRDIIPQI